MKKILTISLTMALLLSSVACGKKSDSSAADEPVPDPVITQTLYKEERIKITDDIMSFTSAYISPDGSIPHP